MGYPCVYYIIIFMLHSRSLSFFKLFFSIILLFTSLSATGYDERFDLKSQDGGLSLDINLQSGHKIYWRESGGTGLPTVIDFKDSANLADYSIWWPSPDINIEDGITNYTYKGSVRIPIELKAADSAQEI